MATIPISVRPLRSDARRNRERIIVAARASFAEFGPDAQMDDIARRAGVGVGTLYRHFATKDALVGELIRLRLAEFAERARRKLAEEPDPWEAFASLLREHAEIVSDDAAQQRMIWAATDEALAHAEPAILELTAALETLIGRAKEAGVVRKDLDVDDVRTLMCGLGAVMAADRLGVMPYDWRRQLEFALAGMRAD